MYAVIRAGGKQYRVAPGDVIKVEKLAPADNGSVEFNDVLAVSNDGKVEGAKGETSVIGQVVEEGRGDKILVFHYKKKKQYKKLNGHRQAFTAVRIARITFDGQNFDAPEAPVKARKAPKATEEAPKRGRKAVSASAAPAKPAKKAAKKTAAKKSASTKAKK